MLCIARVMTTHIPDIRGEFGISVDEYTAGGYDVQCSSGKRTARYRWAWSGMDAGARRGSDTSITKVTSWM